MAVTHTPGPWTDQSNDGSQWGVYASDGTAVAQAFQRRALREDLLQKERTANARLIAAAPELLDMLVNLNKQAFDNDGIPSWASVWGDVEKLIERITEQPS